MLTLNSSIEVCNKRRLSEITLSSQVYVMRSLWEDGLRPWDGHNALCRRGQMFHGVWFPFLLSPAHSALQQQLTSLRLEGLAPCSDILPCLIVAVAVLWAASGLLVCCSSESVLFTHCVFVCLFNSYYKEVQWTATYGYQSGCITCPGDLSNA